ncbi:hypothetical protein AOLI_G00320420 [Acnodon oligacanthus]
MGKKIVEEEYKVLGLHWRVALPPAQCFLSASDSAVSLSLEELWTYVGSRLIWVVESLSPVLWCRALQQSLRCAVRCRRPPYSHTFLGRGGLIYFEQRLGEGMKEEEQRGAEGAQRTWSGKRTLREKVRM